MPRKPDRRCVRCGKLGWNGRLDPAGDYVCHPCRRIEPAPYKGRKVLSKQYALYPRSHAEVRKALLPKAIGKPCPVCGQLMLADQKLHLDHSVPLWKDPTRRPGDRIIHAGCNIGWNRGMKFSTAVKGTTTERGYGSAHAKLRREWAKKVDAAEVQCSACGRFIEPGTKWHLAHDPNDRSIYAGPQHAECNLRQVTVTRRANGNGNGLKIADSPIATRQSRNW